MAKNVPFRLNRSSLVLALISAGFAGQAGAVAGRVEFVIGGATAQGADGRERPLSKGFELDKGDTVKTNDGRAQIRFTDGAYVSLQPNTEFAIKDYNYEGKTDGSERGLFGLARGAMRTVTGFIGRINRNRYQITTPTATVGIRGTGGVIQVLNDGATLINGTSGIWTLTNPVGTIDIPAGFSGRAPSAPNEPPHQTSQPPTADPAPPPPKSIVFVEGDQRTTTGDPASLCGSGAPISGTCPTTTAPNPNPPLVSGSGYHVSYAYSGQIVTGGPQAGVNSSGTLANATFDAIGEMTQFTAFSSASFSGTHMDFGTAGGVIAWGRWTGPMTIADNSPGPGAVSLVGNQNYHYVVGLPATGMPVTGSATFTFLGATTPTGSDGVPTGGTFSGTMNVTFGPSASAALAASVGFTGFTYSLSGTATFSPGSPAFSGVLTGTGSGAPPSGYTCSGCSASVNGAFFGAGAAYAGYAYKLTTNTGQFVTGAAVFKQ
jgi:hypothetical protein